MVRCASWVMCRPSSSIHNGGSGPPPSKAPRTGIGVLDHPLKGPSNRTGKSGSGPPLSKAPRSKQGRETLDHPPQRPPNRTICLFPKTLPDGDQLGGARPPPWRDPHNGPSGLLATVVVYRVGVLGQNMWGPTPKMMGSTTSVARVGGVWSPQGGGDNYKPRPCVKCTRLAKFGE